ncbi:hypothetical protein CAPTEDRAFT_190729, partial [Capitella teleta]
IPVELFSRPTSGYSEQQKDFAILLHLYSPKAYEFIKGYLCLPSSRTIRSWMQHVDAEPGINLSMMQALIVKKNENPDHYTQRTCISGLVVGIDAVIGLSEQLLTTGQMQFLLMYKFSQDHLELFFNAVRRF